MLLLALRVVELDHGPRQPHYGEVQVAQARTRRVEHDAEVTRALGAAEEAALARLEQVDKEARVPLGAERGIVTRRVPHQHRVALSGEEN